MTLSTAQTSAQEPSVTPSSLASGNHYQHPLVSTYPQGRPLPIPTREEFHRFYAGDVRTDDFYTSFPASGNAARILREQKRFSKYLHRKQGIQGYDYLEETSYREEAL